MPRKRKPETDANAAKYFVPKVGRRVKDAPAPSESKYFARTYPLPEELPVLWDGTGPELPEGYEGGEACPDCSAFKHSKHAPLCIRNPEQQTWHMPTAWPALRTKEQIFFGTGHPILKDIDSYMTMEKQRRLQALSVVVMYDYPEGSRFKTPMLVDEERQVISSWRTRYNLKKRA